MTLLLLPPNIYHTQESPSLKSNTILKSEARTEESKRTTTTGEQEQQYSAPRRQDGAAKRLNGILSE